MHGLGPFAESGRRPRANDLSDMVQPLPPRVQLVLGASGGIGSALTRRLRERGDTVLTLARDAGRLEELCAETGALPLPGDARDPVQVGAAVQHAVADHGRLDGAACLIGSIWRKPY